MTSQIFENGKNGFLDLENPYLDILHTHMFFSIKLVNCALNLSRHFKMGGYFKYLPNLQRLHETIFPQLPISLMAYIRNVENTSFSCEFCILRIYREKNFSVSLKKLNLVRHLGKWRPKWRHRVSKVAKTVFSASKTYI